MVQPLQRDSCSSPSHWCTEPPPEHPMIQYSFSFKNMINEPIPFAIRGGQPRQPSPLFRSTTLPFWSEGREESTVQGPRLRINKMLCVAGKGTVPHVHYLDKLGCLGYSGNLQRRHARCGWSEFRRLQYHQRGDENYRWRLGVCLSLQA